MPTINLHVNRDGFAVIYLNKWKKISQENILKFLTNSESQGIEIENVGKIKVE